MKPTFEESLNQAFPSESPTPGLRDRVARIPAPAPRTSRTYRLVFAYAAGALAIGTVVFLAPRAQAMSTLSQIANAVSQTEAWHVRTLTPNADGQLKQSSETWGLGDTVRVNAENGDLIKIIRDGQTIRYRRGDRQAVRLQGRDGEADMKSLSAFLDELKASTWLKHVDVSEVTIDGRKATKVVAEFVNEPARVQLYADATDKFPFLARVQAQRGSEWTTIRELRIDREAASVAKVNLDLPSSVKVVDLEKARDQVEKRLWSGRQSITGKFDPINLMDVQTDREGDVFVIYTNGSRNSYPGQKSIDLMTVTNSFGTQYVAATDVQGSMYTVDGRRVGGLKMDGQDAQVRLFIPVNQTEALVPRTLNLCFGSDSYVVPKGFVPKGPTVSMDEMVRTPNFRVWHTASVTPQVGMPEWMQFIGSSISESGLRSERARVRTTAALAGHNGVRAEKYAREYLQSIQQQAVEEGQTYNMLTMYDLLAQSLALQGKTMEAQRYWSMALDEYPSEADAKAIRQRMKETAQP